MWHVAWQACPLIVEIVALDMKRTYATCCFAVLTVGLTAAPAAAGGLLPIVSPAFGTLCANHGSPQASGTTTHGTGAADSNLAGLPISNPTNQCGGADLTPSQLTAPLYKVKVLA
ncbi:hypothetical protein [Streptomyces sp. NPDC127190]|uniref:hypothetical protein n=1 Tax=unclassified Streptomyces TaxID=2593676 RepID=UPI00363852E6